MRQTRAAIEFLMPSIGAAVSGILNAYKKNSDDLNNIGRDSSTSAMQSAGQKSGQADYTPSADSDPDAGANIPQGQRLKDVMAKAQSGQADPIAAAGGSNPSTGLNAAVSADAKMNDGSTTSTGGSPTQGNLVGGYGNDLTHSASGQSLSAPAADSSSSSPSSSSQSNANSYGQIAGALASAYGSAQSGAPAAQLPQAGSGTYTPTANSAMAAQAAGGQPGQSASLADMMRRYQQGQQGGY
jgi:hypothetical protein